VVFVRPHSMEISRRLPDHPNHFRVTTKHINAAGPLVKVEAITEWGAPVHVEMSQERFRDLSLTKGEEVFVVPTELTVFRSSEGTSAAHG
jgi:sulfate transport system ATP-binding protein